MRHLGMRRGWGRGVVGVDGFGFWFVSVLVLLWKELVRLTALCKASRGQDVRGETEIVEGLSSGEDAVERLGLRQRSEMLYAYLYCFCVCCPERSL